MYDVITHKLVEINYSHKKQADFEKKEAQNASINSPEDFFTAFFDLNPRFTKIVETGSYSDIDNIDSIEDFDLENIINLKRINDIGNLDQFLEAVNNKLPIKGLFICYAETQEQRYERVVNKFPRFIAYPYCVSDFVFKRLFPKWGPTRSLYNTLTRGKNKVLSLAHILGMFTYYGFKINYLKDINNLTYFVLQKIKIPSVGVKPSSGVLFKMKRVGKNGKIINIYKVRTMHPYSEYLQKFMYDINNLNDGGKFKDDFRIAGWGKVLRKYWIDELPMLINFFKGDLKLVGVRPLSLHYLGLYTEEFRKRRENFKPGLLPPFYAYLPLPKNIPDIMSSESKYFDAYEKNPLLTDLKYIFRIFYNISVKKAHSA